MAYLATKKKQPIDNLDYDIWYANSPDGEAPWLISSDQLSSVVVEVSSPDLNVESIVFPDHLKLWVSGGLDGETYKISLTITTEGGRVKQDEVRFRIKEI